MDVTITPLLLRTQGSPIRKSKILLPVKDLLEQPQDKSKRFPWRAIPKWNHSPRTRHKPRPSRRSVKVPDFAAEFIYEDAPSKPNTSHKRAALYQSPPARNRETRERKQVLTLPNIKEELRGYREETSRTFKPYIIALSPRAKITLYGKIPLVNIDRFRPKMSIEATQESQNSAEDSFDKPISKSAFTTPKSDIYNKPFKIDSYAPTYGEIINRTKNIVDSII